MVHALVLSRQPDAEIAEAELDIAGCSELVRLAHGLGLRWRKWCLEELDFLEEDDDLVGGEAFDVGWGRFVRWGRPGFREGVAAVDHAGVEFGLGWEAGLVEPGVPVDGLEGFGGGGIRGEEIEESGFEVVGVEGFLGPGCEVMRDEFVEGWFADEFLEIVEEVESLFVRYTAEGVVGVFALEINDKFGELMVSTKVIDRIL